MEHFILWTGRIVIGCMITGTLAFIGNFFLIDYPTLKAGVGLSKQKNVQLENGILEIKADIKEVKSDVKELLIRQGR